jgi:uncharacterized BrkB/YihY/UPF0761 family membrane protein
MKLSKDLIAKSAIAISAFSALATTVMAIESYSDGLEYTYDLGSSSTDVAGLGAMLAGLGVFGIIIPLCCGLIGLVFLVFNIWMLVDVIKRTEVELPNKNMWMILLIVGLLMGFGGIVGLVYFFGPRKKLNAK